MVQSHDMNTPAELWRRNLWVVWGAQFLGMVGMSACLPFIPFYVRELGVTDPDEVKVWSGLILSGPFVASILVAPLWGALGDKLGLKLMVVRAFLGLALALLFMAFVTSPLQLLLLRIGQGLVSGFISASIAFISAEVPEDRASHALGLLQTSTSSGVIIGPVAGGLLADTIGMSNVFIAVSAICILSGVAVYLLAQETNIPHATKTNSSVLENLRFIAADSHLSRLLMILFFAQLSLMISPVLLPFLVESVRPHSLYLATLTGTLLMARGAMGTFAAPWWGKQADRHGHAGLLRFAVLCLALLIALHSVASSYWMLFLLQGLFGFFSAAPLVLLYGAVSKASPRDRRGGIMGLSTSATQLGHLGGPLGGGLLGSHLGLRPAFLVAALLFTSIQFLVPRRLRKTAPAPE